MHVFVHARVCSCDTHACVGLPEAGGSELNNCGSGRTEYDIGEAAAVEAHDQP